MCIPIIIFSSVGRTLYNVIHCLQWNISTYFYIVYDEKKNKNKQL